MNRDLFGNRSTLDDGDRSDFDFYPTPGWMTRSLVHHMPAIYSASVLECASGDDAITEVLRDEFSCHVIITNDIDKRHKAQMHFDATDELLWKCLYNAGDGPEWVITNPPFNVAFKMLQHAVAHATIGVAFLLRKTFLKPTEERGEWLAAHPPTRIIGLPRHKFRAGSDSSDSVSCDWMIWERHPEYQPISIDVHAKDRGGVQVRR